MLASAEYTEEYKTTHSDALVLFGASGDLAKKMTFVSLYRLAERGLLEMPVIGVAFSDWSDDDFRSHAKEAIERCGQVIDDKVWTPMASRMHFLKGDYSKSETYDELRDLLGEAKFPLYYLEIPPNLFLMTIEGLFMVWRFANRIFEPIWNNNNIESVQITMAESFDVADRGHFYDSVGALKDVVQNHIMQVIGLLSMEPPSKSTPDAIHAEQLQIFDSMPPVDPQKCVFGQYNGYLDVEGVAKDSKTETFIAMQLDINSWRWAGVPFFIRAGKSLGCTATEAVVVFKNPPLMLFDELACPMPHQNRLRFRLGHNDGVQMQVQVLDPSMAKMSSTPVVMNVDFSTVLGKEKLPYEVLLGDALQGDFTKFATQPIIEGTWKALTPLLETPPPIHTYEPGSMGPKEANELVVDYGGWVQPISGKSDLPA